MCHTQCERGRTAREASQLLGTVISGKLPFPSISCAAIGLAGPREFNATPGGRASGQAGIAVQEPGEP